MGRRRSAPAGALAAFFTACFLAPVPLRAGQAERHYCAVDGHEYQANATARRLMANGVPIYLCGAACVQQFTANPEKYVTEPGTCPVYRNRTVKPLRESRRIVNNDVYYLCCAFCVDDFSRDTVKYLKELQDPVSGETFVPQPESSRVEIDGQVYIFSSDRTREMFEKNRSLYVLHYR